MRTYPRLIFLPMLPLYIAIVYSLADPSFRGDEGGYVSMAIRISQGHYSPEAGDGLWWGPGYPMILSPFAYLGIPWVVAKYLNACLLFGALLYMYNTLVLYLEERHAILLTLLLGLYPPFLRVVHILYTENLVFFLICGLMFHFCKAHEQAKHRWRHTGIAALFFGYLALTKVFYGYVILAGLLISALLFAYRRTSHVATTGVVCAGALIACMPYLVFTYTLTGHTFYWGSSGGLSLYWMTTPYETEWGSWFKPREDIAREPRLAPHREFFDRIAGLSEIERDTALKKQAIENIRNHPKKYAIKWAANVGRLLFSYPFSYREDRLRTYFYIIPNMFIVVLFVLSIYPALSRWRSIPYPLRGLLGFAAIAFGGTSLLSAFERQFRPLVPILLLWLAFVYLRIVKIEMRPESEITA